MRAIDVLKYLLAKAESEVPEGHQIVGVNVPVDIAREIIDAQPERPKGDWIKLYHGTIAEGLYCSACGKHGYRSDFCPNCGADMKGEQDERHDL